MTAPLPIATTLRHGGGAASDVISLTYDGRLIRRKRLVSDAGRAFLVDLPSVTSLSEGDAFALDDGTHITIKAAPEALLRVEGDLVRLVWHIGNRHTPCEIHDGHVLIAQDHVLADMLSKLGGHVTPVTQPFTPEGGAYGHGRTFGHSHGAHDHSHD